MKTIENRNNFTEILSFAGTQTIDKIYVTEKGYLAFQMSDLEILLFDKNEAGEWFAKVGNQEDK